MTVFVTLECHAKSGDLHGCARMLNDANNAAGAPMAVKDVAQVVAEAIGG